MTYDKVYELAGEIKRSPEYQNYTSAKEKAMANDTNAALIKEYKKLSMEGQAYLISGKQMPDELSQKLQKLSAVLALAPEVTSYMLAEYSFNKLIGDVFRILGDEVGIDMGFLKD